MKTIQITKGLDIPVSGKPEQIIRECNRISQVALLGRDYIDMKPTMLVAEGDTVKAGQALFTDKKNPGLTFTSPGSGTVFSIHRGEKRRFESIIIALNGEDSVQFTEAGREPATYKSEQIREILIKSGLWTSFRTRPYGKIPKIDGMPSSLFITAIDSSPLAADPSVVIAGRAGEYTIGLQILRTLMPDSVPIHYCTGKERVAEHEQVKGMEYWSFQGPHPSGLASTHVHFIDPVHENKVVWQIGYQDVIGIGSLFTKGVLSTEKIIALCGSGALQPSLIRTRTGASLNQLLYRELDLEDLRLISGSVLNGREVKEYCTFLGRYHDQVSVVEDSSGRSFFNWLIPGKKRFSIRPVFASAYAKDKGKTDYTMPTALWGGKRAIYPLGTYDEVMPLDIIATSLLKSLSTGDTEKSKALGCLELIEEDLSLCGFVCPGKNEFGPMLRQVLTAIERGD